jgi:hypothetical protein
MGQRRVVPVVLIGVIGVTFLALFRAPEKKGSSAIDLLIYGGTPSGVAAAVQAGRMGMSVVLIEPSKHLGGMMSSGLGWTDYIPKQKDAIGGIAREFFRRVGNVYGRAEAFQFEPHVAEAIFSQMAKESNASIVLGHRVAKVEVIGHRIASITTDDGSSYRAKVFVDASYEGDLMAKAGVEYKVGRESNSRYAETLNGVRSPAPEESIGAVSAYRDPNDPKSPLLPFLRARSEVAVGASDNQIEAYGYRLCVTTNALNRIRFEPPPDYKESDYELLARYMQTHTAHSEKLNLQKILKIDPLPNQKFDVNARVEPSGALLSTDFVGFSDKYPEASPEQRQQFADQLHNYTAGLLYFLGHGEAVPESIRLEWQNYGLSKDEFQDNGGWPYQVYVREARRMVSDYVMTEHNAVSDTTTSRSIGLASYPLDCHSVQRFEKAGLARIEGNFFEKVPKPFPIAYDSIVPKRSQCRNLLVTVCLSASHVCFSSIRMEPVEMIVGQSAATAAEQAIADNVPVQAVDYAALQRRLTADNQVLWWPTTPSFNEYSSGS